MEEWEVWLLITVVSSLVAGAFLQWLRSRPPPAKDR